MLNYEMPGHRVRSGRNAIRRKSSVCFALGRIGLAPGTPRYEQARQKVKERIGAVSPALLHTARNRLLYFKALLELENRFTPDEALKLMAIYELALESNIQEQWVALGRSRLMEILASKGVACLILTNENTRTQLIKMRAIDPYSRYFHRIITSEEVGVEKPDARMFQAALEALGLPPSDCLVVGDEVASDLIPAAQLGFLTAWTSEFLGSSLPRRISFPRVHGSFLDWMSWQRK